jgi:hypothetical protein
MIFENNDNMIDNNDKNNMMDNIKMDDVIHVMSKEKILKDHFNKIVDKIKNMQAITNLNNIIIYFICHPMRLGDIHIVP